MKETARRILAAAIPCFAAKGKSGTTTRDVAGAAGVNVATLAYHFGGKDGLYEAAIRSLYERFLQVDADLLDLRGDPRARIEALMRLLYGLAREHQPEVRLLVRHVVEHGGLPASVQTDGWVATFLARIETLFTRLDLALPSDWRLRVLSLSFLLARYAISTSADLAPYVDADAEAAVADHLARLAGDMLVQPSPLP